MAQEPKELPGEELPAPFSNRFNVRLGDLTRISFLEVVAGGSKTEHPRVAVLLAREDAVELAHLILRLHRELEEAEANIKKKAH
jgi:hypothetical protein